MLMLFMLVPLGRFSVVSFGSWLSMSLQDVIQEMRLFMRSYNNLQRHNVAGVIYGLGKMLVHNIYC